MEHNVGIRNNHFNVDFYLNLLYLYTEKIIKLKAKLTFPPLLLPMVHTILASIQTYEIFYFLIKSISIFYHHL